MACTLLPPRSASRAFLAAVVLAAAPLSALADMVPPIVRISNGATTFEIPQESFVFDPETNQFESTGETTAAGEFEFGWDLTANPDPYITGTFSALNISGVTQNFVVSYLQPVNPALNAPTRSEGSVEIGVQNFDGGGVATLTTAGSTPIYQAMIDGATQTTLLNVASLSATGQQGIVSTTASFGPLFGGPQVASDIGVEINFALSGGFDLASGTVYYSVVPEPSTLATIGLGLIAMVSLAWVRRRG